MEWRGGVRRGAFGKARRGEERCIWNGEEGEERCIWNGEEG